MIRGVIKIGLLAMLACAAAHAVRADSILLRSSARATVPVTLRDVAELEGPDAEALGNAVVFKQQSDGKVTRVDLSIEDVRSALNGARSDIRWGKIALSGDSCSLRLIIEKKEADVVEPAPAPAPTPALKLPIGPTWHIVSDLRDETLRTAIATRLVNFLKAEPADVRVAFSEADQALLDTPSVGRTLDIQPTGLGAMVPVMVRVFEGEKVVAAGTAKVRVEQKLHVAGATRALHRGDLVTKEVIFSESRWTTPGERLATEAGILGCVVKNRIQPGELFLENDVEPAILIKRGDIVNIACLAGSIVMNTKARALSNASENEVIEFAPLRNPKNKVTARVVAPGQAVINAEGSTASVDSVYQYKPETSVATAQESKPAPSAPVRAVNAADKASVGAVTVQRVTTKPDGTFVVEAATKDPKKPVRKMKFFPLDEP
jgi:flagella basal body P-ring formation protein FlgA